MQAHNTAGGNEQMEKLEDVIARSVIEILKKKEQSEGIKVGVSARHVHL